MSINTGGKDMRKVKLSTKMIALTVFCGVWTKEAT